MSSGIAISGSGAVSPAGWSAEALYEAVRTQSELPRETLQRSEGQKPIHTMAVPPTEQKVRHPRLRRVSPVTRYAVSAALEALGQERLERVQGGTLRLGVIVTITNGCVAHTRKFYEEALDDPATASPILFPETVFNSPASHIAAIAGSTEINYTLLGDPTQFLSGIDLAAFWLESGLVDGCLVVTAEELDWLSSEAIALFEPGAIISEGAGALYLERSADSANSLVLLSQATEAYAYTNRCPPDTAQNLMWKQLPSGGPGQKVFTASRLDRVEAERQVCIGDTLQFSLVAPAWQSVCAHQSLLQQDCTEAVIPGFGTNQQAIGICLQRAAP